MTPDEVRKLVREEIAKHRNDAPHWGPGHPTESSAPAPAAETCAACGYLGRHGMACPGRPVKPAPDAAKPADEKCEHGVRGCKGRGEKHWCETPVSPPTSPPDAAKGPPETTESKLHAMAVAKGGREQVILERPEHVFVDTSKREWRAYRAVLPPLVLPEYLRADVVEKRVAVARAMTSPELSAAWQAIRDGSYVRKSEMDRVVVERDEARASLAVAEARVRELETSLRMCDGLREANLLHATMAQAQCRRVEAERDAASAAARCDIGELWSDECMRARAERDALRGTLLDVRNERNELEADLANTGDREKALQAQHEADAKEMAGLRERISAYESSWSQLRNALRGMGVTI